MKHRSKLLLRLKALLIAVMLLPQAAWAVTGSGTREDPFIVEKGSDIDDLYNLFKNVDLYHAYTHGQQPGPEIHIVKDIVLTSSFQPFGTTTYPFCGAIEGEGHTISGLNLNYTTSNQGFIAVAKDASIYNLKLKGQMTSSKSGLTNIGTVIGLAKQSARLSHVQSEVNITINGVAQSHIGGLIGHMDKDGGFFNAVVESTYHGVINAGKSTDCIGGIVGFAHAESTGYISRCISDGSIYSTGSGPYMGGILGYLNNETNIFDGPIDCFSRMGLHHNGSGAYVGGIAGRLRAYVSRVINNICLADSCNNHPYNTDGSHKVPESNVTCTPEEARSGKVAWMLHPSNEDYPVFFYFLQKLGTDDCPRGRFYETDDEVSSLHVYYLQPKTCKNVDVGEKVYTNSSSLPPIHTLQKIEAVAPTCYKRGNIEHYQCVDCYVEFADSEGLKQLTYKDVTLEKLPHAYVDEWTWTNNGTKATCVRRCTVEECGYKYNAGTVTMSDGGIVVYSTTQASCSHRGGHTNKATLVIDGVNHESTYFVAETPRLPHKFVNGECSVCHEGEYLTFTSTGNTTIALTNLNGNAPVIEYSIDGDEVWTPWDYNTISLTNGQEVKMRGVNATGFSNSKKVAFADNTPMSTFITGGDGKIAASGRLMSLVDGKGTATTIPSESCFRDIFKNCANLTTAPALTATTLTKECYRGMFYNCPGLTQAPALPSTKLAERCYYAMFYNCQLLTKAPALPATTLAVGCYEGLFRQCTGLKEAPYLPAKTLKSNCYYRLFDGCTKLNYVRAEFSDWAGATNLWMRGVAATGLLEAPVALNCSTRGDNTLPVGWNVAYTDAALHPDPLSFTAQESGSTVTFTSSAPADYVTLQYSTDNVLWQRYNRDTPITLNKVGDKVYFRTTAELTKARFSLGENLVFRMTGKIAAGGSIMSLIATSEATDSVFGSAFCYTFKNCTALTKAPKLPATKVGYQSYLCMFDGCTSLTEVPEELPADNLPESAYWGMFRGCTSLKKAPKMLAKTFVGMACCDEMYNGCSSLVDVPDLTATKLSELCYSKMFKDCTSLTKAPALPATVVRSCYYFMFEGCTSLVDAPALPSTTVEPYCYSTMFKGCTSLVNAPELPATKMEEICYISMFEGCTSLTKAPALPATELAKNCYRTMFKGCTSLTEAPVLPATETADFCYVDMFKGCTSLNRVEVGFTQWPATGSNGWSSTTDWLVNVAPKGTFVCPEGLEVIYGTSKIPEGWVVSHGEPEYQLGDVNGDGSVDVTDVTVLITKVLGGEPAEFIQEVADVDDNGVLDVTDVTVLISKILAM